MRINRETHARLTALDKVVAGVAGLFGHGSMKLPEELG